MNDYPVVRITNDELAAWNSRIEIDGHDISRWVAHYEVIGDTRDATILRLDILVGGLEIEAPMAGDLELGAGTKALLIKNGWLPPVKKVEGPETLNESRDKLNLPRYDFPGADEPMVVTPTGPAWPKKTAP